MPAARTADPGLPRPRILVTLPDAAWPADRGKRMRTANVVRGLASVAGALDVVVVGAEPQLPPGVAADRVVEVPLPPLRRGPALGSLLRHPVPWRIAAHDWRPVRTALQGMVRPGVSYDLVWFGSMDHAWMLAADVHAARVIVDVDDVESQKIRGYLAMGPGPGRPQRATRLQRRMELPGWQRIERSLLGSADAFVVASSLDQSRLTGRARVAVVPNTYPDPGPLPPPTNPMLMVMVGNYAYEPNADAARVLCRSVLPRVRAQLSDAHVRLVGRGGDQVLTDLRGLPGVTITGAVEDPVAELADAALVATPVRYGGGTRIKIIEAFACARPIVSTSRGAEGLDAIDGVHLLLRDNTTSFARACVDVLTDTALRDRLTHAARLLYERSLRPEQGQRMVANVVRDVLAGEFPA